MSETSRVVHTARTRTTGGREHGVARSSDGRLDVRMAVPDTGRIGTNPEHLFAAAWSTCFETGIGLAARQNGVELPAGVIIDAEVDLNLADDGGCFLSARFNVRVPGVGRDVAQSLIDEAHRNCPYSKATRGNVDVAIKLVD
jgi:osmotically inducible protein OsmC